MTNKLYLKKERLFDFFDRVNSHYELYVPTKRVGHKLKCDYAFNLPQDDYLLEKYSDIKKDQFSFNDYRTVEPLKSYLIPPKENILTYFQKDILPSPNKKIAIFGVKNCDIFSLKIQDYVFLEGTEADPFYKLRRENTLLISSDCPTFKEACFCLAFDIAPYATAGFDLNFSPLNDGYLIEIGSKRGQELSEVIKTYFEPAKDSQVQGRDLKRENVVKKLKEHLSFHNIPPKESLKEIVCKGYESSVWSEQMLTCVECGGCNFICDTCHCFLLSDDKTPTANLRFRTWDACQYANFAKVAGGANPLKRRTQRLRNRFLKKFNFFIDNLDLQACCGCGRCIEVCPGKIDIRYILKRLYDEKSLSAV